LYPCILKPAQGAYGIGTDIVNCSDDVLGKIDVSQLGSTWLLQELISGPIEFSTSLLVDHGQLLDEVSVKYEYDGLAYIWPRVREVSKATHEPPPAHIQIMTAFLQHYSGICNFNYKTRNNGEICIFEINPRIGADLAGDVPKPRAQQLFEKLDECCGKTTRADSAGQQRDGKEDPQRS